MRLSDAVDGDEYVDETIRGGVDGGLTLRGITFDGCEFVDVSAHELKLIGCCVYDCRFADCDLSTAMLTGTAFGDTTFTGGRMRGVDFTVISLSGLGAGFSFYGCDLRYSFFAGMDLRSLVFQKCDLTECDFTGSDLRQADMRRSTMYDCRFANANMGEADLRGAEGYMIDLHNTDLSDMLVTLPDALELLRSIPVDVNDGDGLE